MITLLIFIFGLAIGSFLAALTYRIPEEISIAKGRSFCPKCKKTLLWYDNIPLFSYLALAGKCRFCHKKISPRYFCIELSMGLLFVASYLFYPVISSNISWLNTLNPLLGMIFVFIIVFLMMGIFVVDFEHQFIPDEFVFLGILFSLISLIVSDTDRLFVYLLSGFAGAMFLLAIHLATRGKGMGLGDVKLAVLIGLILGFPYMPLWMFTAFILGSIVGVTLLFIGKAKMKQRIAFGPFLVASFLITIFCANTILSFLFP